MLLKSDRFRTGEGCGRIVLLESPSLCTRESGMASPERMRQVGIEMSVKFANKSESYDSPLGKFG